MAAAKARRSRMQGHDVSRASKLPKTDIEAHDEFKAQSMLANAQAQMDEAHDDVKHMNKMMLYSKVVTVRDKQLAENAALEQDWQAEQKKLDLLMEIERLKTLRDQEDREKQRIAARKQGAQVIIEQI